MGGADLDGALGRDLEPDADLPSGLATAIDGLVGRLFESAPDTDRADHLPRRHFADLAELGLYGMVVPAADGGLGLPASAVRAVLRLLGSGCGATAFAFAQHHGTTATVVASPNRDLRQRWVGRLAGRDEPALAGIAYAHVRRPGPPVLRATPAGADGGWILDGQAPWVTSWGLAEVLGVAARTSDGRMVWALVPAREGQGLRVVRRFDLAVFGATATVALAFDGYRVEPTDLIEVVDFDGWAANDRHLAARPNPLCLGIGDRAIGLLAGIERERAVRLASWWSDLGRRAEAQSRAVDRRRSDLAAVAAMRAETVLATQRLTAGLLAAVGGRAMERGQPAQRLHREAGFYVIQAQNDAGRTALLDRIEGLG